MKPGRVVGLEVKHTNPEKTRERLALRLADALTTQSRAQQDSANFAANIGKISKRISELESLLERILHRDELLSKGEIPEYKSRMDPMKTYTAASVRTQIAQESQNMAQLRSECDELLGISAREHSNIQTIQQQLAELNNSG